MSARDILPSLLVIHLLLSTSSCTDEPHAVATVLERDSAGVTIVENTGLSVGPHSMWATLDSTPDVEIGMVEGPAPYMLTSIRSSFQCPNGDIVLADGGSHEIRVFDSTGVHKQSFGGEGEGPGEFRGRPLILYVPQDTILAWDSALWRLTWFTLDGAVTRTESFAEIRAGQGGPYDFLWATTYRMHASGTVFGRKSVPSETREDGIVEEPAEVWIIGGDTTAVRWIRDLPPYKKIRVGRTGMSLFAQHAVRWAIQQNPARVLLTDDLQGDWVISAFDMNSTKRTVIRADLNTRREVTPELVQAARDFQQSPGQSSSMRSALANAWDEMPLPDSTPTISSLHVDAAGRIWAERYSGWWEQEGIAKYDVLDSSGRWLGNVETDRSFGQIMSIGIDHILFLWRDAMDVQRLRRYRLHLASGGQ